MHAQLWQSGVNGPDARHGREHWPYGAAAAAVVPDLEDLERRVDFVGDALQERGGEAIYHLHLVIELRRD